MQGVYRCQLYEEQHICSQPVPTVYCTNEAYLSRPLTLFLEHQQKAHYYHCQLKIKAEIVIEENIIFVTRMH